MTHWPHGRRLSEEEKRRAAERHAGGASYRIIADELRVTEETIRYLLCPKAKAARARYEEKRRANRSAVRAEGTARGPMVVPWDHTIDKTKAAYDPRRDGPLPDPDTLAGRVFGDPSPDRRRIMRMIP